MNVRAARHASAAHLLLILAAALLPGGSPAAAAPAGPELIVHNGRVVTVDPKFTVVRAMSVREGRVTAVGGDDEI
ncbi:MAG: hypothetical protein AVDCRST_MAG64-4019, partial [uncultured Phycisphaerae bacterium]